ncbi:hypothetical protein [Nonomuraea basaltis]|uniref:hypothetical protein n=1 Tax=Nonomuraea basaltis TaxID=2495887 RepID=UPI00110C59A0|nr:hypothetical protein [Nonomuraea basaltis]TMR89018.1 hypothetical protein EJK15_63015 [Nonomuraea basaltis]
MDARLRHLARRHGGRRDRARRNSGTRYLTSGVDARRGTVLWEKEIDTCGGGVRASADRVYVLQCPSNHIYLSRIDPRTGAVTRTGWRATVDDARESTRWADMAADGDLVAVANQNKVFLLSEDGVTLETRAADTSGAQYDEPTVWLSARDHQALFGYTIGGATVLESIPRRTAAPRWRVTERGLDLPVEAGPAEIFAPVRMDHPRIMYLSRTLKMISAETGRMATITHEYGATVLHATGQGTFYTAYRDFAQVHLVLLRPSVRPPAAPHPRIPSACAFGPGRTYVTTVYHGGRSVRWDGRSHEPACEYSGRDGVIHVNLHGVGRTLDASARVAEILTLRNSSFFYEEGTVLRPGVYLFRFGRQAHSVVRVGRAVVELEASLADERGTLPVDRRLMRDLTTLAFAVAERLADTGFQDPGEPLWRIQRDEIARRSHVPGSSFTRAGRLHAQIAWQGTRAQVFFFNGREFAGRATAPPGHGYLPGVTLRADPPETIVVTAREYRFGDEKCCPSGPFFIRHYTLRSGKLVVRAHGTPWKPARTTPP